MKHLINKKLSVKQIFAFIILPLVAGFIIFKFTIGKDSGSFRKKFIARKHARKTLVRDTSALGILKSYVDSINNAKQLFGGNWSFYLTEVNTGKVICQVNIDQGLSPASVMKIVTTGTALSLLGPGFKFSTLLQYDGTIDPATKF